MKIGVLGLGKLGLPIALALENVGHQVNGYDPSESVQQILHTGVLPYQEVQAQELLDRSQIGMLDPVTLANWADLVLVAVQTPHDPDFEGITPIEGREPVDFDYSYLVQAVSSVRDAKLIVVVSTVLPGTMEREIKPILGHDRLLYNPSFIAMGTTIPDFYNPEFVLVGTDGAHTRPLKEMYAEVHERPLFITGIKNAELTKVIYNAAIGLKIALANSVMEICDKIGADCDEVTDALSLATDRVNSAKYLRGGMGDGGGCHPRDQIALSWLARDLDLSYDIFGEMVKCREAQTLWLANLAALAADEAGLPLAVLGKTYKPSTNLTVGSPAILLANLLLEEGVSFDHYDPHVEVTS